MHPAFPRNQGEELCRVLHGVFINPALLGKLAQLHIGRFFFLQRLFQQTYGLRVDTKRFTDGTQGD